MAETNAAQIEKLRNELTSNPDSDAYIELARLLQGSPEGRREGRELCFRGITRDPNNLVARLVLARLFYLDSMFEFSIRELLEIREVSNIPAVDKLLGEFGPRALKFLQRGRAISQAQEQAAVESTDDDSVVAEVDIDAEFLEAIDELKEK
ncbi:MAG: hypothetical protein U0136_09435 [Bdellovibrionota bacterium]